jgi:ATP-dependent RNA helicase RhlE
LTDFSSLGLAAPLLRALTEEGYTAPTPIQAQAIPSLLAGRDLLGIAQTGTGKTAAFALPILHRLAADRRPAPSRGCRVLVLSPTRELAAQIADSFRTYGRHLGVTVATVFGGVGHRPQIMALQRGVDVLVATPGRLLDLMGERHAELGRTEIFVLDEADQMLDLGFIKPIRQIVSKLPRQRSNLFFSATMPREIAGLAAELLHDPVRVEVTPVATTAERVAQQIVHVEQNRKLALLKTLLADRTINRGLVFTRTKRGADRVARGLELAGFGVAAIHGNKSQSQRERALDGFREGSIRFLIATDIAARGIDVDGVSHVVQYDLPEVPEAYVHRIGRTARAGASGIAVAFCDPAERDLLRQIERLTRQVIPSEDRRRDDSLAVEAKPAPGPRAGQPQRGRGQASRGERRVPAPVRPDRSPQRQDSRVRSDGVASADHRRTTVREGHRDVRRDDRRDERREPRRDEGPPQVRARDDRRAVSGQAPAWLQAQHRNGHAPRPNPSPTRYGAQRRDEPRRQGRAARPADRMR